MPVPQSQISALLSSNQFPPYAFTSPVGKGDVLLAFLSSNTTVTVATGCTDTLGNIYQPIAAVAQGGRSLAAWGTTSKAAGACTVTFATDLARGYQIGLMDITGYDFTLDGAALTNTTPATASQSLTSVLPTGYSDDVIIAAIRTANGISAGPPSPWNWLANANQAQAYLLNPGYFGNFQARFVCGNNSNQMIFALTKTRAPGTAPLELISGG
jgi:hypothetical protein